MSKILVARSADLGFIKVVGRGSFQNSSCLKTFYVQLLKDGVHQFMVDLEECTYLDSTFLGILLNLGLKLHQSGHGRLHVLHASPRNLELLRNLGLDRIVDIEKNEANGHAKAEGTVVAPPEAIAENLRELTNKTTSRAEAGPTILEAHEALMNFDARNVPKFKDVVEFLREDLGRGSEQN